VLILKGDGEWGGGGGGVVERGIWNHGVGVSGVVSRGLMRGLEGKGREGKEGRKEGGVMKSEKKDEETTGVIKDNECLESACYISSSSKIPVYDGGFGPLWIHRNSIGVTGIVRAPTWSDAYSICEDEFFPEADETVEELKKEYGFKRVHKAVIRSKVSIPESGRPVQLRANEKFAVYPDDYTDHSQRLPEGMFIRWETVDTPDPDAWTENELFCEAYGFRPNGPREGDVLNHGIYAKDLNGDQLTPLTSEMLKDLGIMLTIEEER
jgi:hypothetical protein